MRTLLCIIHIRILKKWFGKVKVNKYLFENRARSKLFSSESWQFYKHTCCFENIYSAITNCGLYFQLWTSLHLRRLEFQLKGRLRRYKDRYYNPHSLTEISIFQVCSFNLLKVKFFWRSHFRTQNEFKTSKLFIL